MDFPGLVPWPAFLGESGTRAATLTQGLLALTTSNARMRSSVTILA
jgi:hypothetical protein